MMKAARKRTRFRLGFDIGGTFTDVVLVAERTGAVHYAKVPSSPAHPEVAALAGIEHVLAKAGAEPGEVSYVVHGSTVSANAVVQYKGARTGLLTTAGFRDVLEIGRLSRGHKDESVEEVLYNIDYLKPKPIVPRRLRLEVPERIGPAGEVIRPLDEDAAGRAIDALRTAEVESVAICLLHSYANPVHERRLRELVEPRMPGVFVSLSSDVLPQHREFERFSTTCLNAYVMPPLNRYLSRLEDGLTAMGVRAPLHILQATGGVMTAALARVKSIHTALSGFVGGVLGGAFLSRLAGFSDAITLDIGGTSTDVSLIRRREPEITSDGRLGDHPVRIPIVSVRTIGAGGGSIGWVGPDGLLKAGPQSAGAEPGPACYDRGGTEATVTDANVCLGRLNPAHLLDGALPLKATLAHRAVTGRIAKPLGLGSTEAARGIITVANANIARAIRANTVERGVDPRQCVLVAFGGAGPLHGIGIADQLGIPTVLVPPYAGLISALGLLTSDFKQERTHTWIAPLADVDPRALEQAFRQIEDAALTEMAGQGLPAARVKLTRSLNLRYVGQGYEISTPLPAGKVTLNGLGAAAAAFHARHKELYRHATPDEPLEVVAIGVTAVVPVTRPRLKRGIAAKRPRRVRPIAHRPVVFDGVGKAVECPIYRRSDLAVGSALKGPAIVEQFDSTTVLPPGYAATVDPYGSLVIRKAGEKRK